MKATLEPWEPRPGKLLLTVDDGQGRIVKTVCNDEAHASVCQPVLERLLRRMKREEEDREHEAGGWHRRLPLKPLTTQQG